MADMPSFLVQSIYVELWFGNFLIIFVSDGFYSILSGFHRFYSIFADSASFS
jgi:hypothetical protein